MIIAAPALWLPPEKPAIVRAHDLSGLPSWQEMQRNRQRNGTFPFPFFISKKASEWVDAVIGTLDKNQTTASNTTFRVRISSSQFVAGNGGSKIRITLEGATSGSITFSAIYVGKAASSGSYAFATTPQQVLFSGSSSVTPPTSSTVVSDEVSFSLDTSSDLVVSLYASGSGTVRAKTTLTGWATYYKSGNDASTVAATGYTSSSNDTIAISKIESFV